MGLLRRKAEPLDVLVVCTGNLCRSPMMEMLLRRAAPRLRIAGAGTVAPSGEPWHPLAVEALAEAGVQADGAARRLRRVDAAGAALVLTAEGRHRAAIVRLDPGAEGRCFTLLEAARLLALSPAASGIGAAGLAGHLAKALREFPLEHDDDLPDPISGTLDDFRTCRDRVAAAIEPLAAALSITT